jgi:hypothetical protein
MLDKAWFPRVYPNLPVGHEDPERRVVASAVVDEVDLHDPDAVAWDLP